MRLVSKTPVAEKSKRDPRVTGDCVGRRSVIAAKAHWFNENRRESMAMDMFLVF